MFFGIYMWELTSVSSLVGMINWLQGSGRFGRGLAPV